MFGLFSKKIDSITFFIWICSSIVKEFDEHKLSDRSFNASNIKNNVNDTAKSNKIKLTSEQEKTLSLVCGVLTAEFHIDKTQEFLNLIETMVNERKNNPNNREPVIQFGEYLQRYGIFLTDAH
jgi:hypothetical protein